MRAVRATRDAEALSRFKAALREAGYTSEQVRAALKTDEHYSPSPGEVIVFERRVAGTSPLEVLTRMFLIGSTVAAADLEASLPTMPVRELELMGLAERVEGGVRCPMRIFAHGDILLACDRSYYGDSKGTDADVVMGVTSPASLLADITVRKRVPRALDLGTGGGIQALLLANHCERVVAVDINPRAIDFTELNAALNGFDNVEARLGSWFEPVAGELFDIITANPPYVISPDSTYLYRDSGLPADSLCRQLVSDMARHLEEGGMGHILVCCALRAGEEWAAPLRRWLEDSDCDAWLLHYLTEDPMTQAAKWNGPLIAEGLPAYGGALDRWMAYYRSQGIEQIAFAAVILRRRSGRSNWIREDSVRNRMGSASGQVMRAFAAEDFLQALGSDRELLGHRFALLPGHRLDQSLVAESGVWALQEATLTQTEGFAFHGGLDLISMRLLGRLDGTETLGQAVGQAVQELGLSSEDAERVEDAGIQMARRLYQLGFLVRSDP
ncbi:MAG TPA: class I SAM-dependent methyltransferase [Candidatus Dormibacteraeota bacterium]|jgi:methylase of polypeptide subunit release factors